VGLFIGLAQMTRAMIASDAGIVRRGLLGDGRRPPLRYVISLLLLAFAPPVAWYGHWIYVYRDRFFSEHATFLSQRFSERSRRPGAVTPARRNMCGWWPSHTGPGCRSW